MSGISSKRGSIAFAVQSAKGTPATTPTVKFNLSAAPSLGPVKERGRYTSTDASQDQGAAFTTKMAVEGGLQVYAHPDGMAFLSAAVMGANADSGTTGAYSHVATPADDMMWVTAWREVGGVIIEKFSDCKIHGMQIEGSAGQPITVALDVIGCTALYEATDVPLTTLAALTAGGYLYPEAVGRIKIDGTARKIHKLSLSIQRNASGYQSDGYGYDDVDPGQREISLSFETRFASGAVGLAEYREYFYGSASGTAFDPAVGIKTFDVEFYRSATLSWKIALPAVSYSAVPVNVDPGGDPIEVAVQCEVERPAAGNICTITTKDAKATAV